MIRTEKILEEFDKKFPDHGFDNGAENEFHSALIRRFISESINQAIAEDRERVSKLSRYELGGYPEEGYYMEESYDGEYVKFADLLSSLDSNLK